VRLRIETQRGTVAAIPSPPPGPGVGKRTVSLGRRGAIRPAGGVDAGAVEWGGRAGEKGGQSDTGTLHAINIVHT
jgi:hypothetical protein